MPDDLQSRALQQLDRLAEAHVGTAGTLPWDDIAATVKELYVAGGLPRGSSTGWKSLDEFYSIAPQCWTLVTGIPGMGKSEFLDALMVNLAESGEWNCAVWSPENFPVAAHVVKMMEKRARKPFGNGPTPRMTLDEMAFAGKWVRGHFSWLGGGTETLPDLVRSAIRSCKQPGRNLAICIDPWNYLNHHDPLLRSPQMSETEYVSIVLSQLTTILRSEEGAGVHVFVVAHPRQLYRDKDGKYPVPTGYEVSGSANFFNKADGILTVSRDKSADTQDVEIYVQKCRFKHHGKIGIAALQYDRVTGRYHDKPKGGPSSYRAKDDPYYGREPGEDDE